MDREISADSEYGMGTPRSEAWVDPAWAVGLLVGAVVLLTVNLGNLPLRDWDEGIVAQVAREISRSSFDSLTWLYPKELSGNPYFNKPPLVHWLVALSYHFGGISEWTSRLPGAVLTSLSVPLLYWIGREIFFQRSAAVFAALVYMTSLPVVRLGRLAMLDGAVLFFFLVMIWCVLRSRRDLRWGLGVGLSLGALCLIKGILGFLLGAIALVFVCWDTPRLLTSSYVWGGVGLGFVPVGLWYGAQIAKYGEAFIQANLFEQSLKRVSNRVENNAGSLLFYAIEILKNGVPWVLFLPTGFRYAWENRTLGWAKLVLVWSSVYFVAISVMQTKLPWYVLPIYPAFALVVGAQLSRMWTPLIAGIYQYRPIPHSRIWAAVFSGLAIVSCLLTTYYTFYAKPLQPDIQLVFSTLSLTLIVTAVLIIRHDSQFIAVLIWGTYLTLLVFVSSNQWVWELNEAYAVKPIASMVRHATSKGQVIYTSYPYNRPSLNFYSDRVVIPGTKEQLWKRWREDLHPYMLVQLPWLRDLPKRETQVLAMSEDWVLVTRNNSPFFQPNITAMADQ